MTIKLPLFFIQNNNVLNNKGGGKKNKTKIISQIL